MSSHFSVDVDALDAASRGINGFLDQMTEQPVSAIPYGTMIGSAELSGALHGFLTAWQRGVASLMTDGQEVAARLGQCAAAYAGADEHAHAMVRGVIDPAGCR